MTRERAGQIAVIFASMRTADDDAGYRAAAVRMTQLCEQQPGFLGMQATRGADGFGITVSYWESEAHAAAWRDNAEHAAVRALGRGRWYASYTLDIAHITRGYDWTLND